MLVLWNDIFDIFYKSTLNVIIRELLTTLCAVYMIVRYIDSRLTLTLPLTVIVRLSNCSENCEDTFKVTHAWVASDWFVMKRCCCWFAWLSTIKQIQTLLHCTAASSAVFIPSDKPQNASRKSSRGRGSKIRKLRGLNLVDVCLKLTYRHL